MFNNQLESIFSISNLKLSFSRIHSKTAGLDGVTPDEFAKNLDANLKTLHTEIISGSFAPEPFKRVQLQKEGKDDFRPIAISSVKDKVIQNVLSNALSAYFDKSFSNASYAYRKDKSHIKAIHRARDYIVQGFTEVLKSDVESFFENIDHDSLLKILDQHILDRRITRLVSLLIQNGLFEKQSYSHHQIGVHQGDSLSPLLSNIYLDQMDKFIENLKAPFVRYADDFVVLAKTREELEAHKKVLDEFLSTIKLRLNSEKTRIISVRDGFTFLGACFKGKDISIDNETLQRQISKLHKLAKSKLSFDKYIYATNILIESARRYLLQIVKDDSPQISYIQTALVDALSNRISKAKSSGEITTKSIFKEKLAKLQALSNNPKATSEAIYDLAIAKAYDKISLEKNAKAPMAPLEKKKREYAEQFAKSSTLYVGKIGLFLGLSKFKFTLKENGKVIKTVPVNQISNIVIASKSTGLSTSVVEMCAKNSIAIDFIDDNTYYAQLIGFNASISANAAKQLEVIQKNEHLHIAKEFIEGKAKNQLNFLKYLHRYHQKFDSHIDKIESSLKRLKIVETSGQSALMGFEGEMAAVYWDAVKLHLGEEVFSGRITQGASDPVNSALNYGYAILYGRAQKALVKAGLALHISFLHSMDGRKPTLVFDFVEEFRAFVVDKTVIALASKSDSIKIGKDGRLTDDAKKVLLEDLLTRLGGYTKWKKQEHRMDTIIESQAYLLARHIRGEDRYNSFIGKY